MKWGWFLSEPSATVMCALMVLTLNENPFFADYAKKYMAMNWFKKGVKYDQLGYFYELCMLTKQGD